MLARGLHLDMDQGHQVGHARAGRRRTGPQPQLGHQVELPPLPLRRCQEQLLVQPVDLDELEPRRPGGEEAEEEGLEELLEQHLEALVVIRTVGLRHDRLPVAPNPAAHKTNNQPAVRDRTDTQ